jgi:hypothetical protein
MVLTRTDDQGKRQSEKTGGNMDNGSTGKILNAHFFESSFCAYSPYVFFAILFYILEGILGYCYKIVRFIVARNSLIC